MAQVVKYRSKDALVRGWEATLAASPDGAAIRDPRGDVLRTFAQIEAESVDLTANVLVGFAAGQVVGIQIGNHASWPALLLACLRRKVVAVPLESSINDGERERALRTCQAVGFVALEAQALRAHKFSGSAPIDWGERPPALMKVTSGTTAAPRAIRFGSDQLLADCNQICETMGIATSDLNFAVIPFSHSYGFSNLITPLLTRGIPLVLIRDRLPRALLEGLATTNATIFPGMPVFYQSFCQMDQVPVLPALRLCISAGAPLPLAVAQQFRTKFGLAIHSFYGSSECGGICYDREALLEIPGFVGPPMRGLSLEKLEPEVRVGRVSVRSEAVGDGYFPAPDEERLGAGRFIPDDLLVATKEGFQITGRVSDLINVAGKKVNPAEIEAVLLAHPAVRDVIVFGRASTLRNEEVAACVVVDAPVTEADLLRVCRQKFSGWQVPKTIFFTDSIPVNERGKVSRRELALHFARGRKSER
ncbi:MAG TPA: class I adenylate-forming enzyme family protein [Chthoniobacterales bacterium]|nr:class I adenylate-forming enzyme family protein [Chthoniobacterales bacterium]